jgi:hypothetical protein
MTAPGNMGQGVFPDGTILAVSDVIIAYRPPQLTGWSTYTITQLGAIVPTNVVVGSGPFINAGTVANRGTIVQNALSANFAAGATIDLAGTIGGARSFSSDVTVIGLANLGSVQVGAAGFTANGTVAATLTAVAPAAANTTVQEWFTLKNSGGVTRYVPAF